MSESSTSAGGLSSQEAAQRLRRHGPNLIAASRERRLAMEFLSRFRNPLVLLLLAASAISFLTGDPASFYVISGIVFLSVTLDFAQEYRAERAIEKLRESVSCTATLLRDGVAVELPLREVVPGDVALLRAGDVIPADGELLEARDLFVNQALLTGEPFPVEKHLHGTPTPKTSAPDLDAAPQALFMNTSVVSGSARMLVQRTGSDTRLAGIARQLTAYAGPNPLEEGSRHFGMLILRMTLLLVLFVLLVNAFLHRAWLESFMFSVALAVGLTPELLPMIVTVSLARGALRMARIGVIIKRQAAIHNLGSIDTLCTDKTGTLTEAKIVLERHVDATGAASEHVLALAQANSHFESGIKSPLDDAILADRPFDASRWHKIDEVPFDFERRRVAVLLDALHDGGRRLLIVKGAPEEIIAHCTEYETVDKGRIDELDATARENLLARFAALEADGLRVIAVAWRETPRTQEHAVIDDEDGLIFAGFAAFFDPPRAEAGEAVAALARAGIAVKIVTGDHEGVARHVCRETGIPVTGCLNGAQIAALDNPALLARLETVNLVCRVSPDQKSRVITLLRRRGHAVGFMGDGINDAPALRAADVGISVDTGVDVAKEAADVILLKHDLRVLLDGVREGRRAQSNVLKYVMMATSSNFGNMASVAVGAAVLPFLPMLPIQILLNNLLYDLSEFAIPFDHSDEEELARPRPWDVGLIRNFMLTVGPVSSLFDLLTFYVMLHLFAANEALFRTGWFVESLATQVLVIFVIRTRRSAWKSKPATGLTVTSLAVVALAMWLPFSPLAEWFGFVALPPAYFGVLVVMLTAYLLLVEFTKRAFFRRLNHLPGPKVALL